MAMSPTERLSAGPKTVFVIAALLLMGLGGWLLHSSLENARQQAEANTRNLSAVLEARLSATIQQVDANLKELAAGSATFILRPSLVPTYTEETTRQLSHTLERTPEVLDYAFADSTGAVLYAAKAGTLGSSIAEAPFFKALSDSPKVGAVFSGVVKSMLDNRPGVVMARPVLAGDGHVMGMALAFIDIGRMETLIPAFDLGMSGVVAVGRADDGQLVLRKPAQAGGLEKSQEGALVLSRLQGGQSAGTVEDVMDAEGRVLLGSFKRLGQYPFFVLAAEAEEDYLEGWYARSAVLVLTLLACLALLAWLLNRLQKTQESLAAQSEDLEEQEGLLHAVVDELPQAVAVLDAEGRFVLGNPAAAALLGTVPEEMVGKAVAEYNVSPAVAALFASSGTELGDEPETSLESSLDVASGQAQQLQVMKKAFLGEGGETQSLVVAQDVTELRETLAQAQNGEAALTRLMAASGEGLWVWDIVSGTLTCNDRWHAMLGRPEGAGACRLTDLEAHLPEGLRASFMAGLRQLAEGESVFAQRHLLRRVDGDVFWVDTEAQVLDRDEAGVPQQVAGRMRDVTDIVRAEADLGEARDAAEAASQAKSSFLQHVSQEIRTPLHGILGMVEVLGAVHLGREQANAAETIGQSARGMLNTLSDLLDFSALEAREPALVPGLFAVGEVAQDVVESRRPEAERRGLSLNCLLRGNAPALTCYGDESRFRQVLGSLLDNAIKFTPRGSVTLAVASEGEHQVKLEVIDTGIGMDGALVQSLFDPFVHSGGAYGGTGMGLSVSKQLVDRMQGSLAVKSAPRQGSQFTVVLPLGQAPESAVVSQPLAAMPVPADEPLVEAPAEMEDPVIGSRILLVDDNAITRQVANGMLEWLGCEAVLANHGREALEKLQQGSFDLVLMDLKMPEMDGLEATKRMRMGAVGPEAVHVPVIGMATTPSPEEEAQCLAVGMNDYLSKAIDLDSLGEVLARWIPLGRSANAAMHQAPAPQPAPAPLAEVALAVEPATPETVAVTAPAVVEEAPVAPVSGQVPAPLAAKLEALSKQASLLEKVQSAELAMDRKEPTLGPDVSEAPPVTVLEMSVPDFLPVEEVAVAPDVQEPVYVEPITPVDEPLPALDFELPVAVEAAEPFPEPLPLPELELDVPPVPIFASAFEPPVAPPPLVVDVPPPPVAPVPFHDPDAARYPAFDREGMLSLCMNDKDLVEVILRSALNDVSSYWDSLVTAIRQGDSGTASFWVHTLKNLMIQAGGVRLEKKMDRLEAKLQEGRVLREGEVMQEIGPAVAAFQTEAMACLKSLRQD